MNLSVIDLGKISFKDSFQEQIQTQEKVRQGRCSNTLFLCEHPHTVTLPRQVNLVNIFDKGIVKDSSVDFMVGVNRGGDITYHGPGQLVGYLIFDLRGFDRDLVRFLGVIEDALISAIDRFGIKGYTREGFRGVWVGNDKIASIGIGVDRWVSMHGFALNICTDLGYFDKIKPCGLDVKMTSINKVLGQEIDFEAIKRALAEEFKSRYQTNKTREPICA